MRLSEHATAYVRTNSLRALTIATNCRRFERLTGIDDVQQISLPVIVAFRQASIALMLATDTIEKTVTDVLTIVKWVCGSIPECGKRLQNRRPEPQPVPIHDVDLIFAASPHWLRKWICLTYWTGARLSDSLDIFLSVIEPVDVITHRASKTSLRHEWPAPAWLRQWMLPVDSPLTKNTLHFRKSLASAISEACAVAGVDIVTTKQFRQRSITEWTRANATAGAIVHGCGLGVLAHYLDPLSVLESAAPRVRVPQSMRGDCNTDDTEATLLTHFRRMDQAAQSIITTTAERLSVG